MVKLRIIKSMLLSTNLMVSPDKCIGLRGWVFRIGIFFVIVIVIQSHDINDLKTYCHSHSALKY